MAQIFRVVTGLISPGEGTSIRKGRDARLEEVPRFLFVGEGIVSTPLEVPILRQQLISCDIFWLNSLKDTKNLPLCTF